MYEERPEKKRIWQPIQLQLVQGCSSGPSAHADARSSVLTEQILYEIDPEWGLTIQDHEWYTGSPNRNGSRK